MIQRLCTVLGLSEVTYSPALEGDSYFRRRVRLKQIGEDEAENDEFFATLWDSDANLDLRIGEIVKVDLKCSALSEAVHDVSYEVENSSFRSPSICTTMLSTLRILLA